MPFDIVFHDALVVDGSGAVPRQADVGVSGDRISAIGDLTGVDAGEHLSCNGLALAPGFIDIHTHYDPQILWDAELTPSCWYGVTTVMLGNCGIGIAPMRPESRQVCIETIANVEAMSVAALNAGIRWGFESFAEYLAEVARGQPALNVGAMVGHNALRLHDMRDNPLRAATREEIRVMRAQLEAAMDAGAWGFSTSRSPSHVGAGGKPVPCRHAGFDELQALAAVLANSKSGIIQGVGGPGLGIPEFAQLARESGRPVTWCSLHQGVDGGRHWEYSNATAKLRAEGADIWAQMTCMPNNAQFTLRSPYILNGVPAFGKIANLSHEARVAFLTDPAWQAETQRQIDANAERRSFQIRWDRTTLVESAKHPELVGRTLRDIAGGRAPLAVMVELSMEEALETRFKVILFNYDEDEVARLLVQDSSILGLGDGGAHASQICDSAFPLRLLGRYVRERKDFPLEFAVWRMTGHPAAVFGIKERGLVNEGYFADLCLFDPERVAEGPERRVFDFPAGADRLIKEPIGIEHVMVNGKFIRRDGKSSSGVASGRMIRP